MKEFKRTLQYQIKEVKEMAKNPWFWLLYAVTVFLLYYLDLWDTIR